MPYSQPDGTGYQRTDTSAGAARNIAPKAPDIRYAVLKFLRTNPDGYTSEEIAAELDLPYRSVQPRLSELKNECLVCDSGERRMSEYNRPIIVWEACSWLDEEEALALMVSEAVKTPNITYWRMFGGISFGITMKGKKDRWVWEYLIDRGHLPFSQRCNQQFFAKQIVRNATPHDLEETNHDL